MQLRQAASTVAQHRQALETPFHGSWAGAANGDVVLVEFFDYACGYCRAALPDITRLLAEDKRLKVVYRELPILSDGSALAARVGLHAAEAGRYAAFHRAMYAERGPGAVAHCHPPGTMPEDGGGPGEHGLYEFAGTLEAATAACVRRAREPRPD